MIRLSSRQAEFIQKQAETAWPKECCGLLIGRLEGDELLVDEVRPCRNLLAPDSQDRFEIDPQDRFDAQRQARAMGRQIVGHYHSHPNGVGEPSATDKGMMFEPELVWLIVGVQDGRALPVKAFQPDPEKSDFAPLPLVIAAPSKQN